MQAWPFFNDDKWEGVSNMDKDTTEPTPSGNIRITKIDDGNIRLDVIDLITAQTREINIELWSIATNILDDDRDRMWVMVDEVREDHYVWSIDGLDVTAKGRASSLESAATEAANALIEWMQLNPDKWAWKVDDSLNAEG